MADEPSQNSNDSTRDATYQPLSFASSLQDESRPEARDLKLLGNPDPPKRSKGTTYDKLRRQANTTAAVITLFAFLVSVGIAAGYFYSQSQKPAASTTNTPTTVEKLTPSEINKLSQVGTSLGTANQLLDIGANALIRGNENVDGSLSINGQLNANGPVNLSQLSISGSSGINNLNVAQNLNVNGTTSLKGALSVASTTSISGNLLVTGTAAFNNLAANALAVRSITLSGPLQISHIVTDGSTPGVSPGGSIGSGGTVSISGDDTSGQVNISTGNNPGTGLLASIRYSAAFSGNTRVELTPISADAALSQIYVLPSPSGFEIMAAATPTGGRVLQFDYFVTQ